MNELIQLNNSLQWAEWTADFTEHFLSMGGERIIMKRGQYSELSNPILISAEPLGFQNKKLIFECNENFPVKLGSSKLYDYQYEIQNFSVNQFELFDPFCNSHNPLLKKFSDFVSF